MGELRVVEKYRNRAGMPYRYYRDMVFEILTDEFKHASKYNFIMTLSVYFCENCPYICYTMKMGCMGSHG